MSVKCPRKANMMDIFKYSLGEGSFSIAMNGANSFSLIFLTQILGLNPAWASLSISISILWDAITDPLMGHISDNTRSRWGRRHQYILAGGWVTAIFFFMFWSIPQLFTTPVLIFTAALVINLLIKTAITVYTVPYTALGFEICPEYESRARVQGTRYFISQMTNFIFVAGAWSLFFRDRIDDNGMRIDGSLIASNYILMGAVLAVFIIVLVTICAVGTRRYAVDNRGDVLHGNNLKAFWKDFSSVFKDRLAVFVFIFFAIAQFAIMLMGQVQMFTYIFFMQFSAIEKTCVHGGGMLAFALASLSLPKVVKRLDKKPTGYLAMGLAFSGGMGLLAVFTGGILVPQQQLNFSGVTIPVATIVFGLLQMCWWGGCGLLVPLVSSMVADVAAINYVKTGELKNASYASIFSFCTKAMQSVGMLICGSLVHFAGIISGAPGQTPEAIRNISIMTFVNGPVVMILALLILRKYPVTRETMNQLEMK